ncbi:MAG: xylulokinase [Promethearchaeota archaeon]
MKELFLGLDCSTQGLTAIIIGKSTNEIEFFHKLDFDTIFPQYNTKNGVLLLDEKTVHSPPLMWVEALEAIFDYMLNNGVKIENIRAISGSAQQHGQVYLNNTFEKKLRNLDAMLSLTSQLEHVFSRETSPIWMDSSTSIQCEEIRQALGGKEATIKITGSNTFERFSGPQIKKFYQENPKKYSQTTKIHLVSSFLASILLGENAPIDYGDGAGMNLMNIQKKQWDQRAINATAPDLKIKLPRLCASHEIIGKISPYFVKRFGFNPDTCIVAWSGDNPNSLIGVGLIEKGKIAISLGTSDTYFSYLKELTLDLRGEGHVFGAPTGDYMSLICYKNGSLTREHVKNSLGLDWQEFSRILNNTPPGNYGRIMLPYYLPEIVPLVLNPQIKRFGFDEFNKEGNVRAVIEGQILSMKLHSDWINEAPEEIMVTGGASVNDEILQTITDIFRVPLKKLDITNTAALGAALRSLYSYTRHINEKISWQELINAHVNSRIVKKITPRLQYKQLYNDMVKLYKKHEDYYLKRGPNPEPFRQEFIRKYFG